MIRTPTSGRRPHRHSRQPPSGRGPRRLPWPKAPAFGRLTPRRRPSWASPSCRRSSGPNPAEHRDGPEHSVLPPRAGSAAPARARLPRPPRCPKSRANDRPIWTHTVSRPRREVLREVDRELHALAEKAPSWRKAPACGRLTPRRRPSWPSPSCRRDSGPSVAHGTGKMPASGTVPATVQDLFWAWGTRALPALANWGS
jgi:hypothetical protein